MYWRTKIMKSIAQYEEDILKAKQALKEAKKKQAEQEKKAKKLIETQNKKEIEKLAVKTFGSDIEMFKYFDRNYTAHKEEWITQYEEMKQKKCGMEEQHGQNTAAEEGQQR